MASIQDPIILRTGEAIPLSAIEFATSRSGGPGGQNVNKVETRVEAKLQIDGSPWLSESTQARIRESLSSKIDEEGRLRVVSSSERTQLGNKSTAVERLRRLIDAALVPRKQRRATKPTKGSQERRREAKRRLSEKKDSRRWRE